ncbi:hypothetical protein [Chitinophaga sp. GbtcB8]|uniref:hypothetical protein n=1 Tax=Chitinophaga sp. GbtcB8 TaxID=2824753 RepID=UPI001C306656|nr:hypothetical protein [Chitinophaga sp. GbtcB8]
MQQVQTNAPSNAAARVPAATNNSTHTGAAKPAVAPLQLLKDLAAEEPVETGHQGHTPQESWSAVQQKQERLQPALQKKESTGAHVLQRRCAPQQLQWVANYEDSGLTVEGVFSDADIQRGYVINDEDKGTVAHEFIQKANGGWIREYGIPPVPPDVAWHYADMVKDKDIYEIKPEGGVENAVAQATRYVNWANVANPGHKLATAAFNENTPLLRKELPLLSPATGQVENDTFELGLHYWNDEAGEILYKWGIKNLSAEARRRAKEKRKREEKKGKEQKEKNEKIQKGQAFSIASWAKKKPAPAKTASAVAESPSATAEPTEAPEPEAEEPVVIEEEESTS